MEIVNWKTGLDEMCSCKLTHNGAVHTGDGTDFSIFNYGTSTVGVPETEEE